MHPSGAPADRLFYRSEDGWEAPLWRYPPRPGASGEPVLLAHGLGASRSTFDLIGEDSIAHRLHQAGYDVYLLEHRGDAGSVPPGPSANFDFDDIVAHDVPAALARVREVSGAGKVLWVGHALGGQLMVAHMALGGAGDLAAGVALCTPVRFQTPRSSARLAAMAAQLVPEGWRIPARSMQRAMAPFGGPEYWQQLSQDVDGPVRRGLMLHGTGDLHTGLLRQVARWFASGTLCDREDQVDYAAAVEGLDFPLLAVAAAGDPICPPAAAHPLIDGLAEGAGRWVRLDETWGHLDPLVGRRAREVVLPELEAWLERHRARCWQDRVF